MSNPNNKPLGNLIKAARVKERATRRPLIIYNPSSIGSVLSAWVYWKRFGNGDYCDLYSYSDISPEVVNNREIFVAGLLYKTPQIELLKKYAKSFYVVTGSPVPDDCLTNSCLPYTYQAVLAWRHCYGSTELPEFFTPTHFTTTQLDSIMQDLTIYTDKYNNYFNKIDKLIESFNPTTWLNNQTV